MDRSEMSARAVLICRFDLCRAEKVGGFVKVGAQNGPRQQSQKAEG